MSNSIIDPIFILGVPRSGTTLLRVLLDGHSQLLGAPETAWITGGYGGFSLRGLVEPLINDPIGAVKNLPGVTDTEVFDAARLFANSLFSTYLDRSGKQQLILKTPDDIRYLSFLNRLFPTARYLHIYRDGRDVACSTFQQKGRFFGDSVLQEYGDLTQLNALRRWVEWEQKIRYFLGDETDRYFRCSYEALVNSSEAIVSDICGFLRVEFEPTMLDYQSHTHSLPEWEAGSTDVAQKPKIESSSIGAWQRAIPSTDWHTVDEIAGDLLTQAGYRRCCDEPVGAVCSDRPAGIDLGDQVGSFFGHHRSGWSYAIAALAPAHDPKGVYLESFVEKKFVWSPDGVSAHCRDWVGFIHVPPGVPDWFNYEISNERVFDSTVWQQSLPFCKGLFTLSDYHKRALDGLFDFPIESLIHPTEIPTKLWSWERFKQNSDRKIIQVGWWLRKMHAIYQLPESAYRKVMIRANNDQWLQDLFNVERDILLEAGEFDLGMYDTADVVSYLPNDQYDDWLSENICFISLYDASANNAVIECIARGTPLLVNRIAPVVEYLGPDYPFYFDTLEEAIEKAANLDLVRATHLHLLGNPVREQLSADYFRQSVVQSDVLMGLRG